MTAARERRVLQWLVGIMAAAVFGLGVMIVLTGSDMQRWTFGVEFVEVGNFAELESSLRFFGGLMVSTALLLAWSVPRIERADPVIQMAAGGLALGVVGRLIAAVDEGWPNAAGTIIMSLEAFGLVVAVWQLRVKRRWAEAREH